MNEWNIFWVSWQYHKVIWIVLIMFKKRKLNLIRPKCNERYGIHNRIGLKLLTHLRIGLSHLNNHKSNYNFRNCINPYCTCSLSVENNVQFFIHFHNFSLHKQFIKTQFFNWFHSQDRKVLRSTILKTRQDQKINNENLWTHNQLFFFWISI